MMGSSSALGPVMAGWPRGWPTSSITGALLSSGALVGKVGSAFSSTATQHGGQETTLMAIHTNLMHFGMVCVGLPCSWTGQMTLDENTGGTPYGATTIAGGDGSRKPSDNELEGARFRGRLIQVRASARDSRRAPSMPAGPA